MGEHVAKLAVHWHEPFRRSCGMKLSQLVAFAVPRGVKRASMDDFGSALHHAVDHGCHCCFVAGDRVRAQHDGVFFAELDPAVVARCGRCQRGTRFGLRAGGEHAKLAGREIVGFFYGNEALFGNADDAQIAPQAHIALHRHAERGDHSVITNCSIHDLLNTMKMAGEAGHDDPSALIGCQHIGYGRADFAFRSRAAGHIGVGGIGQQQADAGVAGEGADAG